MEEAVVAVKHVTDIMAKITAASQEQSGGIEQVNTAIAQMDEATQRNAALVEEAAASAESLEEQAGALANAVAAFKLSQAAFTDRARNLTRLPTAKGKALIDPGRPAKSRAAVKDDRLSERSGRVPQSADCAIDESEGVTMVGVWVAFQPNGKTNRG